MVHLIFEGAELSAKSFLISTIYPVLEKRDHTSPNVLDGCYWFNADIGIFGTDKGPEIISKYVEIAEILRDKNILFEKLHISDMVYRYMYGENKIFNFQFFPRLRPSTCSGLRSGLRCGSAIFNQFSMKQFSNITNKLQDINFKIVLTTFREDEALLKQRLEERIKLYPHYARIAKPVSFYLEQQRLYKEAVKKSLLPYLEVDMSDYDASNGQKVIEWAE